MNDTVSSVLEIVGFVLVLAFLAVVWWPLVLLASGLALGVAGYLGGSE